MPFTNHGDGKKIRVQSAMGIFLAIMGFVFLIDAKSDAHAIASVSAMLVGVVWYYISSHIEHWYHTWHHH